MRNSIVLVPLLLLGVAMTPQASERADLILDDLRLELRSSGSAYYAGIIHVYDAALFADPRTEPDDLLDSDVAKCLTLSYRVGVKAADIRKAATKVLARQHDDLTAWRDEIDALHAAYRDVDDGDRYSLCHHPRLGTELLLNDVPLKRIETPGFDGLYFGIWLGDKAISKPLRDELRLFD